MKILKVRKIISFISCLSLLAQTLLPLTLAMPVYAEDSTPSAIVDKAITPEATPTLEPTPEVTITPEATPTPEITPIISTPEVTVTPEATVTPEPTPEATPTVEPTPTETLIDSPPADNTPNEPTVTTDKADYAPTDTVQVAGMFFLADTPYVSTITSDAGDYSNATNVVTDSTGAFFYLNPLDGVYRPNYSLAVTDASSAVVASTTFTDTPPVAGLKATKTNDLGSGNATVDHSFTWKIKVENVGQNGATFDHSDEVILLDNLPSSHVTYGTPTFTYSNVHDGDHISCSIDSSKNLTCKPHDNGHEIIINAGGYIEVSVSVTFNQHGTYTNPRSDHVCKADPDSRITDTNRSDNNCSNTVTVEEHSSCSDVDHDGVCDTVDNCRTTANSNQADRDGDRVGDVCDNCPSNANANQTDSNGDGTGDVCTEDRQVTICHAPDENSSHDYNEQEVSINSVASGDDWDEHGHGDHSEDIWPAFTARNGDSILPHGDQTILNNHCEVPTQTVPLLAYKYEDSNANGVWNTDENGLSGWTIRVYDNEACTGESLFSGETTSDGRVSLGGLTVGHTYWVSEDMVFGWENITGNCRSVTMHDDLHSNNTIEFGNHHNEEQDYCSNIEGTQTSVPEGMYRDDEGNCYRQEEGTMELGISKSNDASGDKTPGSSVGFKIVLNVSGANADSLSVSDLLPAGFTYRAGSYLVKVNGVERSITEPVYHSPGTWNIGSVNAGDEVELTYLADISSDNQPGTYTDLAWAVANGDIYATGHDSEFVDGTFVGTEVNVVKDQTQGGNYDVEKKVEGQVLGASTSLPATGASPMWPMLAFVCLVYGIRLIKSSNKSK